MKKINVLVLSALTAAFLVGCGGGGSSGSSGSSSSSSSAFPSNAVIAEANLPNGQKVEENIDENVVSQYNYLNSVTDSRVNPSSIGTDIANRREANPVRRPVHRTGKSGSDSHRTGAERFLLTVMKVAGWSCRASTRPQSRRRNDSGRGKD